MLHRLFFLAFLFLTLGAMAQEPAPCALVVPGSVTPNSEAVAQASCPCPITAFEGTVYSRWGSEVWSSSSLEGFPGGLLAVKDLQAGTYLWKVKYTTEVNGQTTARETSGYVNVLK
jgi:hypothetical protein